MLLSYILILTGLVLSLVAIKRRDYFTSFLSSLIWLYGTGIAICFAYTELSRNIFIFAGVFSVIDLIISSYIYITFEDNND